MTAAIAKCCTNNTQEIREVLCIRGDSGVAYLRESVIMHICTVPHVYNSIGTMSKTEVSAELLA